MNECSDILEQKLQTSELRRQTEALAQALGVVGLMNVQFAIKDDHIYLLEVNPRGSRTVPFVAKATGKPLAQLATRPMAGESLADVGLTIEPQPPLQSIKEAVLPFRRFPGADTVLGPEMRSTGAVMGSADSFGMAYAKAELGAGAALPTSGRVFLSTHDRDKAALVPVAARLIELGFDLIGRSQGGGSDGNFTGYLGIPTLDSLGVRGEGLHTLTEHIEVSSLVERAKLMSALIMRLE